MSYPITRTLSLTIFGALCLLAAVIACKPATAQAANVTVSGVVFTDDNVDGIWNANENPVADNGGSILVQQYANGTYTLKKCINLNKDTNPCTGDTVTAVGGIYAVSGLDAKATYQLCYTPPNPKPDGVTGKVFPVQVTVPAPVKLNDASCTSGYRYWVTASATAGGVDTAASYNFGMKYSDTSVDAGLHTVSGKVYKKKTASDSAAILIKDSWTIALRGDSGQYLATVKPDGSYSIGSVPSGEYTLNINPTASSRYALKYPTSNTVVVNADLNQDIWVWPLHTITVKVRVNTGQYLPGSKVTYLFKNGVNSTCSSTGSVSDFVCKDLEETENTEQYIITATPPSGYEKAGDDTWTGSLTQDEELTFTFKKTSTGGNADVLNYGVGSQSF